MDKSEILDKLRGVFKEISLRFNVKKIGLFGSFARNMETDSSDIDILIEFAKPIT